MLKRISLIGVCVLFILSCATAPVPTEKIENALGPVRPAAELDVSDIYGAPAEGEAALVSALTPQFGWDFALALGKIGSHKEGLGFRLAGTPEGKEAADLVYKAFEDMGLKPEYYPFEVFGWRFLDASISIQGRPEAKIPIVAAPGAPGTPKEGITGELVFVGHATTKDLAGKDLRGKIALVAFTDDYVPWMSQAAYQPKLYGASAVIYYCEDSYAQDESGEAFYVADWSGPNIDIPVLTIGKKFGQALVGELEKQRLTVTVKSEVEIVEKSTGYNVVAMIQGTKYPEEYVILDAHTDAYFYGFMDDSLPMGLMLTIAKAMVESGYKPDRTIVFASVDAEEFGVMDTNYDWLIGSWNLLKDKKDVWPGKTVANMTLELLGYKGTKKLEFRSSDSLYMFVKTAADGFESPGYEPGINIRNTVGTWSDEWSFSYHGIPTMRTHTDYAITYNFYHSQFDTADRVSFDKYADNLIAFTRLTARFDKLPAAPYDLARTANKYHGALNQDMLAKMGLSGDLAFAAKAYEIYATELLNKNILITRLLGDRGNRTDKKLEDLLVKYNQAQRDVARIVIMGSQYLAGEDVAFQTPYYQEMPAMFAAVIEALEKGSGQEALDALKISGKYYAAYLDYETWWEMYKASIDPVTYADKLNWAEGRMMRRYNIYKPFHSIRAKTSAGRTDFSEEIAAFTAMRDDSLLRLREAYSLDLEMWRAAKARLPLKLADQIIALLLQ